MAAAVLSLWLPIVLAIFAMLPARRATVVSLVAGWLFLPMFGFKVEGLPAYDKASATCLSVLLGTVIFDPGLLTKLRPKWVDLAIIVWCVCPFFSSLSNDLGVYDGLSATFRQVVVWGLPYLIGRIYFSDLAGIWELAVGVFYGGLAYMPLCLWEIRMSPQLHVTVYGFGQHSFLQTIRFGGYRPMVFMQHGLAVGMWMAAASLVGLWLWVSGALKSVHGIHIKWWLAALLVTTVLCKSSGALALLLLGVAIFLLAKWRGSRWLLLCTLVAVPAYITARATGYWSGDNLVSLSDQTLGSDRAQSLEFRLQNEDILVSKARERPILGWGGWGRNRVQNDEGNDVSVTDGLWIITFGTNGIVGLAALTALLLIPTALILRHWPASVWAHGPRAPAAALAVLLVLYAIDCLLNAMINPIFIAAIGGMPAAINSLGAKPATAGHARGRPRRVRVRRFRKTQDHQQQLPTSP